MTQTGRRPGRPSTVTAEQLAEVALNLWDAEGYAEVSLGAVADAAGVSIRTVHRYFPSKSDIVWRELVADFGDLRVYLGETSSDGSLLSRIRLGILASIDASDALQDARLRLNIISRTPELHTDTSEPFITWRQAIEDFATEQLAAERGALGPRVLAAAVQATTMAALVWWAERGEKTPTVPVDRALQNLERGFGCESTFAGGANPVRTE